MKEQVIQLPDNFEVKEIKDGKIILVEKKKKLTYEDIAREMFPDTGNHYYIANCGYVSSNETTVFNYNNTNNATSKKQLEKLLAINKLMNVAKYLNGDWQLDWNNRDEDKIFIYIDYIDKNKNIKFGRSGIHKSLEIYFKTEELAKQAIEILGEEAIKLALCTDY